MELLALEMEQLMRTTKRFTPKVLARFVREGRGQGTGNSYIPWHRVSRSDPSSHGRSHLQMWNGRQAELLSDGEKIELLFATMLTNLVDVLEQFRLSLVPGRHELSRFCISAPVGDFPGTLTLTKQLGMRHPTVSENGETIDWTPSTDLLLVLKDLSGGLKLIAVSVKPSGDLPRSARKSLALEKAYWDARGVKWLLITPSQFDKEVALTLQRAMPWGLGESVLPLDRTAASDITRRNSGRSLTYILEVICYQLGIEMDRAQRAFWQAVWHGEIPLDLRRGWRPHIPIVLLPIDTFWSQNPIASRRSAWN